MGILYDMVKKNEPEAEEAKVQEVIDLYHDTPDGVIVDADTILKDIIETADTEICDLSIEILGIWQNSSDRASVEALFYSFTGVEFVDFIDRCITETSRKEGTAYAE